MIKKIVKIKEHYNPKEHHCDTIILNDNSEIHGIKRNTYKIGEKVKIIPFMGAVKLEKIN